NSSTNRIISSTGSTSAISSASSCRRDRRTARPARVSASDIDCLLRGGEGLAVGGQARRGAARQGQEHVIQGGRLDREAGQQGSIGVDLVEQLPDVIGRAVSGQA